jgi:NAD-dependent SIR2 family protein deacetylase
VVQVRSQCFDNVNGHYSDGEVEGSAIRQRVVIVNDQPTPMDDLADAVIRTPISEALPTICGV